MMYPLKPIVSLPERLYHSRTMYEMRNIHEEPREDDHTTSAAKIVPDITEQLQARIPEFTALENRQEKILAQLAELKKQVSKLHSVLKQTIPSATIVTNPKTQEPITVQLIVNVNPERLPYSILALKRVWKDVQIQLKNHVHSSINGKVPAEFEEPDHTKGSSNCHVINISLIWKEVDDLELKTGLHSYSINGESNFLRYVARLIDHHNYENLDTGEINLIESVLDLCHSVHSEKSQKRKQDLLIKAVHKLSNKKSNEQDVNIANIILWSTIKQVFQKNVPAALSKWFTASDKLYV